MEVDPGSQATPLGDLRQMKEGAPRPLSPAIVLLYEDDPIARELMRDLLEEDGYAVLTAPHLRRRGRSPSQAVSICSWSVPGRISASERCRGSDGAASRSADASRP